MNAEQMALRRRIRKYAEAYTTALKAGKVPKPGAGDCFFCQLRSQDGKTMGEAFNDPGHIREHIRERYYVPSLLLRAVEVWPGPLISRWAISHAWGYLNPAMNAKELPASAWKGVTDIISHYCAGQLMGPKVRRKKGGSGGNRT